ncbi:MAG: UDP-2,3-diacylglucosamine diphosphatase LpxI [Candidatus Omnitrophica bacterium]|nr:UDP-2,3-diacylglucosamine diphosphatase LpxI [Candidatus Omnitrophota bacterium]
MQRLGIIAGRGIFPYLVAEEARASGCEVYTAALSGEASKDIEKVSDKVLWVKLGELGKLVRFFQKEIVHEAIMAGQVRKPKLFSGNVRPDLEMVGVLSKLKNWKDETLLSAVADYLERKGIRIIDSTTYLSTAVPREGVLTKREPNKKEWEDIAFGFQMARQVSGLDIGQTVVVKKRCVVAVESIEGTDEAIRRGGHLAGKNAVVVKVARPKQDMRFDVPAIGLETIRTAVESGIGAIAVEAGRTILFDGDHAVKLADQNKLVLVAASENFISRNVLQKSRIK